jgi:cardiolipin synthase A/B
VAEVSELIEKKRRAARQISLEEMDRRPLSVRLRDGLARLLSPYL